MPPACWSASALIEEIGGYKVDYSLGEENRKGDHICYISDLSKLRSHYPDWEIWLSLRDILAEMISAAEKKLSKTDVTLVAGRSNGTDRPGKAGCSARHSLVGCRPVASFGVLAFGGHPCHPPMRDHANHHARR